MFNLIISGMLHFLVFFNVTGLVQGQVINKKYPAVYLKFEGPRKTDANQKASSELVRLVLHNNTRWSIFYTRLMESSLPGDVPVSYIIELATGCRDDRLKIDVVSTIELKPGKTVSFTVPKDDFSKGSKIYVGYSFSWEMGSNGYTHPNQSVHRAYFSANDLPTQ